MAILAFILLLEYPLSGLRDKNLPSLPPHIHMEILTNEKHTFFVINRDKNSKLSEPETWEMQLLLIPGKMRD